MIRTVIVAFAVLVFVYSSEVAMAQNRSTSEARNVLGRKLESPPSAPAGAPAGYYRDGYCNTGADDTGSHVVASTMTKAFLDFTRSRGNDLQTPRPERNFPGLKPDDGWCVCAARWQEAEKAGVAPPVNLNATHESATRIIPLDTLKKYQKQ